MMASKLFLLVAMLVPPTTPSPEPWSTNTYIVQTANVSKPPQFSTPDRWYASIVAPRSTDSQSRILHTYHTVMHGFAVRLTADEARRMSRVPGVSGVYKDRVYRTQTTRSPGFLGLDPSYGAWPDSEFGDGVIVGFIDSGIWPERASFNDTGLGPVRATWKGKCIDAHGFNASLLCNNKLVGARAFTVEIDGNTTPRDYFGHGTHVSATAAGSEVRGANLLNFSGGSAFGMAPRARISMYKACSLLGCNVSAIVAAIDAAVSDGVDILSISLADDDNLPFPDDVLAVATFGAERHGVFVVLAGGNAGPAASSVRNAAPWMTTVGATTQDRVFPAQLKLGNGVVVTGQSLFAMTSRGATSFRLVNSTCRQHDLTPDTVMGTIVVCIGGPVPVPVTSVQTAGGAGLVAVETKEKFMEGVSARTFDLPALIIGSAGWDVLNAYMASSAYPVAAMIFDCDTVTGKNRAPMVAAFSSRGPNSLAAGLLKPDLLGPGVNILAAWTGEERFIRAEQHDYTIISGTSMACPHVAGVAALIKKRYGDWTPAMVRSALMTTAKSQDNTGSFIIDNGAMDDDDGNGAAATPLAAGAGLVRPGSAMYPGLVYDAGTQDYVDFLCAMNYSTEEMRRFVPGLANCARSLPGGVGNLNYPSFVVIFDGHTRVRTLTRTVTKVSKQPAETYNLTVAAPDGVNVTVTPATLVFNQRSEQRSYTVEFRSEAVKPAGAWDFGKISWKSDDHIVVSPVAFTWE